MITKILSATTPQPKTSTNNTAWLIGLTLLFLGLAYFAIKFAFGWKRSLNKTKNVLGKELVKPYVQGFSPKSSSFFTYMLINVFTVVLLVSTTIVLVKLINRGESTTSSFAVSYYALLATTFIVSLAFNLFMLISYLATFKEPQYAHSKNLPDELRSLKNQKTLTNSFPEEIKLDLNKITIDNPLAPRVLAKFIKQYNDLNKVGEANSLKAKYYTYLDQKFKILYFNELNNQIEVEKENEGRMLGIVGSEGKQVQATNKIEEEIIWMDKADAKAKLLMETKDLVKNDDPKERNSNYEDYLYNIRANDPIYANVKRNTFVTYRDIDIEDLFYNPSTNITYSLDGGKTTLEKPLHEFLNVYHGYLVEKFYGSL
ncbi:Uncharacterised protein [Metamycoplasma arthritidis]|uniref:Hypothetical membrane protein n=1 Tax=Metamycoplasma arthritidis (strain 158L3-1) TaxID=243272 RepID=B3PMT0_META1|nr:hypothetical protein [Metamycoplasma arthritidis]ACF07332.1 hypothetical membrane protein [Metamycoplasma arthritidis 158L3-1]VEU78855.1 Uncharacterised protein [Metamycoplasma arthritidis]